MNGFDEQLDIIDEQLQNYEAPQRWMISIGSAAGILLMGWMFYLSDALEKLATLREENTELSRQIAENSPEAYRAKISRTLSAVRAEEAKHAALATEKEALIVQMSAQEGLIFDNRAYAQMLERLLAQSVRLGLKIEVMESEDTDKVFHGKIKQFKKLTVTGAGRFPAVASFLSFVEAQNALVQIESVKIESGEEKPRFRAVILYMGVAL